MARGGLVSSADGAAKRGLKRGLPVQTRRRINAWLDSFPEGAHMTREAAHFMYLLEAYEEMAYS